ncbi:MAG: hypothetical protein C0501_22265 [Isosphaera sp.]|nr:hypothetical protein [Isosphaera sp.]
MPDDTCPLPEPELSRVVASYLEAVDAGRPPDPADLIARHPHLADELRAFLAAEGRLAEVAGPPGAAAGGANTVSGGADRTLPPDGAPPPGAAFGEYDLLGFVGYGGMGVVYRARHRVLKRVVALKLILAGRHARPADRERFRVEAEAAARLSHPGIVQVYEVGEHDGLPYLAMEFCPGGSLAAHLRAGAVTPAEAARIVAELAAAVQAAHDGDVVHRDLKPGNVLRTADGRWKVADFGLAKLLDAPEPLTGTNAVLGSPPYMSPEQADGRSHLVGRPSDVYSLGAVLFELLTGRPPFRGETPSETVRMVLHDAPPAPRRLNRAVPRDLQTICLRCLEKSPARRFATAADLADDLGRFLTGRPPRSRPVGPLGRARRWCGRNPVPTAAAAVVSVVALVAFVLIYQSRDRALGLAGRNAALAERNEQIAADQEQLARVNGNLAAAQKAEAENARREKRAAEREATLLAYRQGQDLCEKGDVARGLVALGHGLALADQAEAPDLADLIRRNLGVWHAHLNALDDVWPHPTGVAAVAVSPDGTRVATADWAKNVRVRDAATGEAVAGPVTAENWVTGLAFSPDGKTLLAVAHDRVVLIDPVSGKPVGELFEKDGGLISAAAFRPDGAAVVTGGSAGKLRFWDVAKRGPTGAAVPARGWVRAVAWSPDGAVIACGYRTGGVVAWDAKTREPRYSVGGSDEPVNAVAFSPDGRWLAVGGDDRAARVLDAGTGEAAGPPLAHTGRVTSVAFSPDGLTLVSGGTDRTARVWQVPGGAAVGQLLAHSEEVLGVAFGPDGRTVFTAQGRGAGDARRWRVGVGQVAGPPLAHAGPVLCVAVDRGGTRFATGSRDGTARLWDARTGEPVGGPLPHGNEVNALAFAPDGKLLLSAGDTGEVLFWDARLGRAVVRDTWPGKAPTPGIPDKLPVRVTSARPGALGLGGDRDSWNWFDDPDPVWGPARGKGTGRVPGRRNQTSPVHALAFAPGGAWFAFGCRDGKAYRVDADELWVKMTLADPREEPAFGGFGPGDERDVYAVAVGPDGTRVAVGRRDGTVRVWDVTPARDPNDRPGDRWHGKPVGRPARHDGPVVAVAFAPDGKTVLTAGGDGAARVWETETGNLIGEPARHRAAVVAAAFAPDGKTFLTASWDGSVRTWRTDTGGPVGRSMPHPGRVLAAAYSPDGRLILSGGEDGAGRLWDAATGLPVGPPLPHRDQVRVAAFRPDGRAAVTAGDDGAGALWAVPGPVALPPRDVTAWLEVVTGMRRDADGVTRLLDAAGWAEARAGFRKSAAGEPASPDPDGWHRRSAALGEAEGAWEAARWHLERLAARHPADPDLRLRHGAALFRVDRPDPARREFERAAALAPDRWEPHAHLGRVAARVGDWKGSAAAFDRAIAGYPKTGLFGYWREADGVPSHLWHGRGAARAAGGEWANAIGDLRRAALGESHGENLDLTRIPQNLINVNGPLNPAAWLDLARAYLAAGRGAECDAACRNLAHVFVPAVPGEKQGIVTGDFGRQTVHPFGTPTAFDPHTVSLAAWVCALRPEAVADYDRLAAAALACARADPRSYPFARSYGAVLYRAGKFDEAVKQLDAARRLRPDPSPAVWLFLAMALHQTGDKAAADWLDKAKAWVDDARKPAGGGRPSRWDALPWQERAALEVLVKEAEGLVRPQ